MDYLIHKIFYTNLKVTTKQIIKTKSHMINKEKTRRVIRQNNQTEMAVRNKWEKKQKEMQKNRKISDKTATLSPYISIITLNVNGLNSPIKRYSCRMD